MTTITLTKTETKHLLEAAEAGGSLTLPDTLKPASRDRMVGRLLRDGLIEPQGEGHRLLPAGYRAVGLRPPRVKRQAEPDGTSAVVSTGGKKALVQEMLGREAGATLPELIAATGWLPHTTRAVLSRLRSSGQELLKEKRDDGVTAYRIVPAEPAPARTARKGRSEASAQAAA